MAFKTERRRSGLTGVGAPLLVGPPRARRPSPGLSRSSRCTGLTSTSPSRFCAFAERSVGPRRASNSVSVPSWSRQRWPLALSCRGSSGRGSANATQNEDSDRLPMPARMGRAPSRPSAPRAPATSHPPAP